MVEELLLISWFELELGRQKAQECLGKEANDRDENG